MMASSLASPAAPSLAECVALICDFNAKATINAGAPEDTILRAQVYKNLRKSLTAFEDDAALTKSLVANQEAAEVVIRFLVETSNCEGRGQPMPREDAKVNLLKVLEEETWLTRALQSEMVKQAIQELPTEARQGLASFFGKASGEAQEEEGEDSAKGKLRSSSFNSELLSQLFSLDIEEDHLRVIEEKVKETVNEMQNMVRNFGARIVILGAAGAGKSSCVNAAFHRAVASTGVGISVTQGVTHYPATNECPIHIYDTKGFEAIGDNQDVLQQLKDLLAERRAAASTFGKESPEYIKEQLHAVWWIIDVLGGGRFSPQVMDVVKTTFEQEQIPVVIVLNKCDTAADFVRGVEQQVQEHCPWAVGPIRVVADPKLGPLLQLCEKCGSDDIVISAKHRKYTCEECGQSMTFQCSYGIDELVRVTADHIPEMVAASFLAAQNLWLDGLKRSARKIISSYTVGAAGLGFAPLPFQSRFFISPLQLALVAHLAAHFDIVLSKKASLHILLGVGGVGLGATAGCFLANFLKMIPVIQVVGMVSDAAVSAAATAAIGMLSQELFCRVRGKAIVGEVTPEHFKEVMATEEQKDYFRQYLARFAAPFQELLHDGVSSLSGAVEEVLSQPVNGMVPLMAPG